MSRGYDPNNPQSGYDDGTWGPWAVVKVSDGSIWWRYNTKRIAKQTAKEQGGPERFRVEYREEN